MKNDINFKIKKQVNEILFSEDYYSSLKALAESIVSQSKVAPNEATIESIFDRELFHFFKITFNEFGFEYNPIKEASVKTRKHISKGRADTAIASLVIEFKQPKTLSNEKQKIKAIEQISDYLKGLVATEYDSIYEGFVTDGVVGCFVTLLGEKITIEHFYGLDFNVLDRIVRNILELKMLALNSRNLVEIFCGSAQDSGKAFMLVSTFYGTLKNNITPKTTMLFNEWKELFNLAHDDVSKQQAIIDRRKSLEELLGIRFNVVDDEYLALFALQTAYAFIIKVIAFKVLSQSRYKKSHIDFYDSLLMGSEELKQQLQRLEDGEIFRDFNILNLLEGDFFSWYVSDLQWNEEIYVKILLIFDLLSKFSDRSVLNDTVKTQDFFKDLYQAMVPSAVRHSLGEYYTKKWLANNVIENAIKNDETEWTALDPCCGSGTFLTVLIESIKRCSKLKGKDLLINILSRVKGIDLNPLAVLSARVNYFLNIAGLIDDDFSFEIPVYLGDSSYVPKAILFDEIKCYEYTINTLKKPIDIVLPASILTNSLAFSQMMTRLELYIKTQDVDLVYGELLRLVDERDKTNKVLEKIRYFAEQLVFLEKENWDGIWARIVTNFLNTANLGKFDYVFGNPPWVDWKSLPSGYRNKIKSLCISRNLFSGDVITGGINLNICALIANVACENWLKDTGTLGFLMPEPLVFQQSYEGFRNFYLENGQRLYFYKFVNWNKAGHPFHPVTQKFLTFYLSSKFVDYSKGVPVICYEKKVKQNIDALEDLNFMETFSIKNKFLICQNQNKNFFTYVDSVNVNKAIGLGSGYIGREGIEFYPQELMLFTISDKVSPIKDCIIVNNYQNKKSKYKIPKMEVLIETNYLHFLVKGKNIIPYHVEIGDIVVPFPYEKNNPRVPLKINELASKSPRLAKHYLNYKNIILEQTGYNERIIGKKDAEFYALARVGEYSFADYYVTFRDNTKWAAAVVGPEMTPWGEKKRPLFQNHAVSICQDSTGRFITEEEAYFICGIFNSPQAYDYMMNSSDSRSFPIRLRIYVPLYDRENPIHKKISDLAKKAHKTYYDNNEIEKINGRIKILYDELLSTAIIK